MIWLWFGGSRQVILKEEANTPAFLLTYYPQGMYLDLALCQAPPFRRLNHFTRQAANAWDARLAGPLVHSPASL